MKVISKKEFTELTKNATKEELHTLITKAINEVIPMTNMQLLELVKLESELENDRHNIRN